METSSRKTQCPVSKILQRYIKELKLTVLLVQKALDNDLNQMSHRYVSGVLQNEPSTSDFRSFDRSLREC